MGNFRLIGSVINYQLGVQSRLWREIDLLDDAQTLIQPRPTLMSELNLGKIIDTYTAIISRKVWRGSGRSAGHYPDPLQQE